MRIERLPRSRQQYPSGHRPIATRFDKLARNFLAVVALASTRITAGTKKAGDEFGNGRFIVRYLGAERYLDAGTVAVLLTLRENQIADIGRPTAADLTIIDTALIAYYNFLRTQRWIGNLSLIFEGEAFGQASLNEIRGPELGDRLKEQLERLTEVVLMAIGRRLGIITYKAPPGISPARPANRRLSQPEDRAECGGGVK